MSELDQYIKENTNFLKLEDGERFEGIYKGVDFVADRFDQTNENKVPEYKLQYLDMDKIITWTTKSMRVAQAMKDFKDGDKVQIIRVGEGNKTTYSIKKV